MNQKKEHIIYETMKSQNHRDFMDETHFDGDDKEGPKLADNKEYVQILRENESVLGFHRHFDIKDRKKALPDDVIKKFLYRGNEVDDCGLYPIHKACMDYPENTRLIGMMLRFLPQSIGFQVQKVEGSQSKSKKDSTKFIIGMYPIQIAIMNNASFDVIKLLVRANPQVLTRKDGSGMVALSLAFRLLGESSDIENFNAMISFLLAANPHAAKIADNRSNTPLHYACMTSIHLGGLKQQNKVIQVNGQIASRTSTSIPHQSISTYPSRPSKARSCNISFELISNLIQANPDAVIQRNFNGDTPLDLAQNLDERSMGLLQSMAYKDEEVEDAPYI